MTPPSPPSPSSPPTPENPDEEKSNSSRRYALTSVESDPVLVRKDRSTMYNEDGSFNENNFYSLLGNDIRRKILSKLAKFQRYASDLAIDLGVSKQAIKKHLDKLVKFGLVKQMEVELVEQKKQYYQINSDIVLSAQIDLTPNYFHVSVQNTPEDLAKEMAKLEHDPRTAMTSSTKARIDYDQLNHTLKYLGGELHKMESQISEIETNRKNLLMQKTVMLNRIQLIINAIVEDDLEKEVIFSLFFDTHSTVEGLTLNDIINELFLRKRKRAGVPSDKHLKTDPKTIERGQQLLELLEMLINNFGFIRSEDMRLYFDFEGGTN
ncbi:MAG: ArsR/SmtB family transcription factor [Promethearchaeota archaeon]